jgi:hypothetical protein
MTLILKSHWAGFFSCCSMRIWQIILYIKNHNKKPDFIDNRESFIWYNSNKNIDIIPNFFHINNDEIIFDITYIDTINWGDNQFEKYSEFNFNKLNPLIQYYFSPSEIIINIINNINNKYSLNYENICAVFLRGNDKVIECNIPNYETYIEKINKIKENNQNIKFIFQSDETNFLEKMNELYPDNIIFYDEIRHIKQNKNLTVDNHGKTPESNYKYALNFLAIIYIISKCRYVICNTGNISMWIALFRNNTNNFIQL